MTNNQANTLNYDFVKDLDLDQDVSRRLSLLLSSTERGSSEVLMSPIGRDFTPKGILSEWDKVFHTNKSKMNETLINLEQEQRDKFSPMSVAKPWSERKATLLASYSAEGNVSRIIDRLPNLANGKGVLRPISVDNAMKLLQNSTNSGLPFFTKKGIVKDKVLKNFGDLLSRKDPCALFTRTQEQGKTRNVWGFPMADTLNEMRYYAPLLSYQKKLSYRAAVVGPVEVNRQITNIFKSISNTGYHLVSIDFSAYDNTVKSSLQKRAFNYIKSLFQISNEPDLTYISERFNNIGIVTPDGVFSGSHGVPSGSTFTNEVDSISQAIVALSHDFVDVKLMQIQGDDGVYAIPENKYREFMDLFKLVGLKVNEDKSYFSPDFCVYLQNLYHKDYMNNGLIGGIYPIYRALNRIVYQERWADFEEYSITGRDYYAIRTICIVENCKYHPLFEEFVKFMVQHDKYSLDPSDQGIVKYVRMLRDKQSAGGPLNHQHGDNVDGIRTFETYKMIKRLS